MGFVVGLVFLYLERYLYILFIEETGLDILAHLFTFPVHPKK